jgi:hypothetical protein
METMKNLLQHNWYSTHNSNPVPHYYEAEVSYTVQQYFESVKGGSENSVKV